MISMSGYFGQYPLNKITKILYYLPNFLKLFWKLFRDPKVSWYKKVIPVIGGIMAIAYILSPVDAIPDFLLFLGQLDDMTVVLLFMVPSIWIFIRSCPNDLVKEHARLIGSNRHL
jgi:uncharacterized membrane protein YkvA (DUF1232 family)